MLRSEEIFDGELLFDLPLILGSLLDILEKKRRRDDMWTVNLRTGHFRIISDTP